MSTLLTKTKNKKSKYTPSYMVVYLRISCVLAPHSQPVTFMSKALHRFSAKLHFTTTWFLTDLCKSQALTHKKWAATHLLTGTSHSAITTYS